MEPIFTLFGTVVHGKEIGRKMNMPTANIKCEGDLPLGVFASVLKVGDKAYKGVTNIGQRPTVDDNEEITAETYLLSFRGELYGKEVKLCLYKKLRETMKFPSKEALRERIKEDESQAAEILKETEAF